MLLDEYRILVDMRWNKQYLDILANKCNFEDEERYMEFLETLNAVANRYSGRVRVYPAENVLIRAVGRYYCKQKANLVINV